MHTILHLLWEKYFSISLFVLFIFLLLVWTFKPYFKYRKWGIPVKVPFPLIGSLSAILGEDFRITAGSAEKYGKYYISFLGGMTIFHVLDVDVVKQICISNFSNVMERTKNVRNLGGMENSDVAITGARAARWSNQRRIFSASFTGRKLRESTPLIISCANVLLKNIKKTMEKGKSFDVLSSVSAFTLDAIACTEFGIETDSLNNPDDPLARHANSLLKLSNWTTVVLLLAFMFRPVNRLLRLFKFQFLEDFKYFQSMIKNMVATFNPQESSHHLFHTMLSRTQKYTETQEGVDSNVKDIIRKDDRGVWFEGKLTENEVLGNSLTFMIAAYLTTAKSLSFLLYNLSLNPDIQDKVYSEICSVCPNEVDLDYDLIKQMPLLEQCILENLRMYPPATRTSRLVNEPMEIDGHLITPDMLILIDMYAIHHNPKIWKDPFKFDPSRFAPEVRPNRDDPCFMPFGVGPRNCIGSRLALLEMHLFAAVLLRHCRFVVTADTPIPMLLDSYAQMNPKSPIRLGIELRPR